MRITREGRRFFLGTFLIVLAAVNTGNNLIFLILSLMLSFVLLAILLLRINFSGLSIEIDLQHPVFAGETATAAVLVRNSKQFVPSYSLTVSNAYALAPSTVPFIPPKGTLKSEIPLRFSRRGVYRYKDSYIQSGFPFILFTKRLMPKIPGEVLVYPALLDIDTIMPPFLGSGGREVARPVGNGDEICSIREFRYGDDWKRIHWKASAKAANFLVKEYSEQELKKVTVILDNLVSEDREFFEKAVSLAASLCGYFLDMGYLVRILSSQKVVPFGMGNEHLYRILDILAVIQEESVWDCLVPTDTEGLCILILKSHDSFFGGYVPACDVVIYASTV